MPGVCPNRSSTTRFFSWFLKMISRTFPIIHKSPTPTSVGEGLGLCQTQKSSYHLCQDAVLARAYTVMDTNTTYYLITCRASVFSAKVTHHALDNGILVKREVHPYIPILNHHRLLTSRILCIVMTSLTVCMMNTEWIMPLDK
jgi:hypothetical protein